MNAVDVTPKRRSRIGLLILSVLIFVIIAIPYPAYGVGALAIAIGVRAAYRMIRRERAQHFPFWVPSLFVIAAALFLIVAAGQQAS